MLTTETVNPIPVITDEKELTDWEEFPEGYEEVEEDDSEQACEGNDSIAE